MMAGAYAACNNKVLSLNALIFYRFVDLAREEYGETAIIPACPCISVK
jgi:hypothetical protein